MSLPSTSFPSRNFFFRFPPFFLSGSWSVVLLSLCFLPRLDGFGFGPQQLSFVTGFRLFSLPGRIDALFREAAIAWPSVFTVDLFRRFVFFLEEVCADFSFFVPDPFSMLLVRLLFFFLPIPLLPLDLSNSFRPRFLSFYDIYAFPTPLLELSIVGVRG